MAFSEALVTHDFLTGVADFLQSYSLGGLRPNTVLVRKPAVDEGEPREHFLRSEPARPQARRPRHSEKAARRGPMVEG